MKHTNFSLTDALHVWRHLPPGATLPTPRHQMDKQLLGDLLTLPDGTDALHWLEEHRLEQVVHIALREAVLHLWLYVRAATRAYAGRRLLPRHKVLGGRFELNFAMNLFEPLGDGDCDDLATLRTVFRNAQALWEPPASNEPLLRPDANNDERILALLLSVPPSADPAVYLRGALRDTTVPLVAHCLREQSRYPRTLNGGPPVLKRRLDRVISLGYATFTAEQLGFLESGTSLTMGIHLDARQLAHFSSYPERGASWSGFTHVVDDQGYHYAELAHLAWARSSYQLPIWTEHIEMTFYPAVARGSSTLKFMPTTALLDHRQLHRDDDDDGHIVPPTVLPGSLDLTVDIPDELRRLQT